MTSALVLAFPLLVGAATYDDLINSARMGDTSELSRLAGKGASVDTTDIDGNTLLMLAARDGHADTVDFLIKNHAKLNAVTQPAILPCAWQPFAVTRKWLSCCWRVALL